MWIIPRICGAAVAVVLLLSGCVPTPSPAAPTPKTTAEPVFASEAEALEAATEAYAAYVRVSDEIFMDGGNDAARLNTVATGKQLATNLEGFAEAHSKRYKSSGGTTFDHVALQSFSPDELGDLVTIYVCDDLSSVTVMDSSGQSVVAEGRPNRTGYQASFSYSSKSASNLLLSDKEPWADLAC